MTTPVTLLDPNTNLYLSAKDAGGGSFVIALSSTATAWHLNTSACAGVSIVSTLSYRDSASGNILYMAGDIGLLKAAGSCPLVLSPSTATVFAIGGVPINGIQPVAVNGDESAALAISSELAILQKGSGQGWKISVSNG
ncbi:hypothetical protein [Paraburkholderia rhizosphaerae]|uniref:Uncharacterized protein n=1 Tax=Paraburkholderia rhizosphaerae TaxID=480658 RepID=A0A4V3HFB0_9BURK|nr:hypothetical protein [Paraburkholderia rhizosphaerae]TDY52195.1 hypothetical protein BX592_10579 [Paraburkholderia rhizosphaerae]